MNKLLDDQQAAADLDTLLQHTLTKVANGTLNVERAHKGLIELLQLIDKQEPRAKDWLEQGVDYLSWPSMSTQQ
ncbi:hypothetical protein [Agarivorans sp.]|uniref:hypothetical protein n=1 Tax=Agarivorans sp. TaxID=1872412 RepID=UPI003D081721